MRATMAATSAFVGATMRSMLADRTTLFFTIVLPIGIITIIGTSFGGAAELEIGIVGPPSVLQSELVAELDENDSVVTRVGLDIDDARADVRRFDLRLAVVLPDDVDAALARGETVTIGYLANEADQDQLAAIGVVQGALDEVTLPEAAARAVVAADDTVSFDTALEATRSTVGEVRRTPIEVATVGDRGFTDASPFALTAAQNLVLFTFLTSLTSATLLVRHRETGVLTRALAAPVGTGAIGIGVAASWFLVAVLQSALIVVVGAAGFGVDWGDPLGAVVMVMLFALTGAGAGLVVGALFGSQERLGAAAPPIGLVLGALGGCMVPSEIFPDTMQTISRITPHYWALDGWQTLIFDGGDITDLATPAAVLGGYALVALGAGSLVLRRRLTSS